MKINALSLCKAITFQKYFEKLRSHVCAVNKNVQLIKRDKTTKT